MSLYEIVAVIIVFLILCAGILFSPQWLAPFMAAAVLLFGFLAHSMIRKNRNPVRVPRQPAPETPPPAKPAPAAADETRRLIYEEKLAAVSKFSSVISHELRNPLASLKNIAYFLSKALKIEDERTKRMLEMMSGEIDKTNDMISNLTDVSHLKRVNKILSDVSELTTTTLDGIKLPENVRMARNIEPVSATLDPDKYKKVVRHLVTNATDALTPTGGQITVALKKGEKVFELIVQDNGSGMDQDTLHNAFEPMFTTKTKALGLGLTFAKEVAAFHGGTLSLASEKGNGTTATVTMPL